MVEAIVAIVCDWVNWNDVEWLKDNAVRLLIVKDINIVYSINYNSR